MADHHQEPLASPVKDRFDLLHAKTRSLSGADCPYRIVRVVDSGSMAGYLGPSSAYILHSQQVSQPVHHDFVTRTPFDERQYCEAGGSRHNGPVESRVRPGMPDSLFDHRVPQIGAHRMEALV